MVIIDMKLQKVLGNIVKNLQLGIPVPAANAVDTRRLPVTQSKLYSLPRQKIKPPLNP